MTLEISVRKNAQLIGKTVYIWPIYIFIEETIAWGRSNWAQDRQPFLFWWGRVGVLFKVDTYSMWSGFSLRFTNPLFAIILKYSMRMKVTCNGTSSTITLYQFQCYILSNLSQTKHFLCSFFTEVQNILYICKIPYCLS